MNASPALAREQRFDWPLCYEAETYLLGQLEEFTHLNRFAKELEARMRDETGTLLLDWVDHLILSPAERKHLAAVGYVKDGLAEPASGTEVWWHPEAMLPRVLLRDGFPSSPAPAGLAVRCERMENFWAAHHLQVRVEGPPMTRYRRALISNENGTSLEAVERRGYCGFVPASSTTEARALGEATELWRTRVRQWADDAEGFRQTHALLDRVVALVGSDLACHAVFAVERAYWQQRNRAAQIQKARQDRLGLGWANHDHHTFRSSRRHFVDLMLALEKLGFERRERYYAGAQAGWGAQILEQPREGIVAFCDVDLEPEETQIDFSRCTLPPTRRLGTIGLWVGLHGESFLDAGLHHLECRFDYESLRVQLAQAGIVTMKPFSDFAFLKQAFTEGERWPVRRERVERLRREGLIDDVQCRAFLADGAIGSHLENLQRRGGFKGFNQKSVSVIIQATDPRLHPAHH